ncbi:MAG: hypothetical protein LAP40_10180 [Acidobacteriia bacterium]|nr:hypothetical protein [Terriglobia bacterium]
MPRFLGTALALLFGCALAHAQHVVFTMRTHPTCPVLIASLVQSKDFGFQAVTLLDDSPKAIDSMMLTVVLTVGSREEVVDGGRVFAMLAPGDRKSVDVFLGRIQALQQRVQELRLAEARAIIYVDSVDFSDGTRWDGREPVVGPGGDVPLRK